MSFRQNLFLCLNGSMEAAAFSLHYATTPRKNDETPRFRQTFAKFRHQFRLAEVPGDFRPTHW